MITLFPALTLLVASFISVGVTHDVKRAAKQDVAQDVVPPAIVAQQEESDIPANPSATYRELEPRDK